MNIDITPEELDMLIRAFMGKKNKDHLCDRVTPEGKALFVKLVETHTAYEKETNASQHPTGH